MTKVWTRWLRNLLRFLEGAKTFSLFKLSVGLPSPSLCWVPRAHSGDKAVGAWRWPVYLLQKLRRRGAVPSLAHFLYGVCRDSFTFTYSFILFYLSLKLVTSQSVIRSGIRAGLFWISKQTFIDITLQDFGKNDGFVSTETRLMSNSQHALHPGVNGGIRYKKNLHKLFLD
jgi:hypothetical protein